MFHFKNCQLHLQTTRISLHVRQIHPWGIYGLWRVFTCAFGGLNDGKLDGANIWDWRPHHFSGPNWNFYALEGLKVNVLNFFSKSMCWIFVPEFAFFSGDSCGLGSHGIKLTIFHAKWIHKQIFDSLHPLGFTPELGLIFELRLSWSWGFCSM